MLYMLDRPFQAHPLYFDVCSSSLEPLFPLWFGASWKSVPPSLRLGAKPLLVIPPDEKHPLGAMQGFIYDHTTCREPYFVFHGGAVTRGDDAFLFLAATTTGKTTLITYLTQMGYCYLDDDCFYMNMDTLEVLPYSAPIHLRDGGRDYLQAVLPHPLPPCTDIPTPLGPRHVFMPELCTQQATRPKAIFFLDRSDGATLTCTQLPSADALLRLFTSSLIPYQMSARYIRFFSKLTPLCYQLCYRDAAQVLSVLDAFAGGCYDGSIS